MQKKLIALAVASLASGAAFAQTNVTIYGIADAGYVYSTGSAGRAAGTNTFSGVQSGLLSGSRLGFKGEEALGNGLKAIFTLEYSLNIDNNSGVGAGTPDAPATTLQARQQFVGLSSAKLGTVALGRQYAPGYAATINNDPLGGAAFGPMNVLTATAGNTINPGTNARWDNAVTYTTPNWGGFTAKGIYSFGERSVAGSYNENVTSVSDNGKWGLGANFANGPLNLDLVYQERQNVEDSAAPVTPSGNGVNEVYVGGSFDLKMVKLMASWQAQNDKNALNADNQTWQVGAVIPVLSASKIHLQYGSTMWDQGNNTAARRLTNWNGNTDAATIAWTTSLSKRTTLYAGYVWIRNDDNSRAAAVVSGVGARGEDNNTFAAGLNHSF
ncbi:MAG: porin [Candidatus Accumulibacter sp.]|jgi:predicted porin|nr:porin [Accumulibacter sp.]